MLRILLITLVFFQLQASSYGQLYLNEIMASNATIHADIDFGNYTDWIEIYNAGTQTVDLSGWFLSDDVSNPTMWMFQSGTVLPPSSYLLVYADGIGAGMHANFKLSKEGETLMLLDSLSAVVDSFSFPPQLNDISFGRSGSDPGTLGFFTEPTPGTGNQDGTVSGITPPPSFSHESGFYTGSRDIIITCADQAAEIRYTTDGTEPTKLSLLYEGAIPVDTTTVLRARSFAPGQLTGPPVTHSYFIGEPQNLPVISLVTDPDHFFSDETGIYVIGTAGVAGYCTEVPHNVNQDWERPVNIELIERDGTVGLNQVAGVKIFGGCSRVRYPIKSLALFARKEYETSSFGYSLFPDKPNSDYESFVLRAGADDQPFTMIRDPLTAAVVKDVIDVDVQAHRPVVVYINGEYWGIHNLREKINEAYLEDNFGVNPDSVELLTRNPEEPWNVIAGNPDHYNGMISFLKENDISQEEHYETIKTVMDVDEYINYQIIQIFFGGRDWPGNNIKFWRYPAGTHNRWRWILYDLDHMFKEYFSDIMEEATEVDCGCVWPNPPWSTYLFRRLLENEEFRDAFVHRFSMFSSTHFSRERLHRIIDEMEAELLPELPRHIGRWGGQKTDLPDNTWVSPIFESLQKWQDNMQVIRDFVDSRHEVALQHVSDYFGTDTYAGLEIHTEPAGTGAIQIGSSPLPELPFAGTFTRGEVLELSTTPASGYLLSHWEITAYPMVDTSLIVRGDTWKYLVTRDLPDSSWIEPEYDDSHWLSGQAELGYGDSDEQTVVDFGGDPDNKIITTWFRKVLTLEEPGLNRRYTLHLLRDDGARVFVNGVEVIRNNLNRYWVGGYSLAELPQDVPEESMWFSYEINPSLFTQGENVIAVEVHQASVTSSDLSFDLELVAHRRGAAVQETRDSAVLGLGLYSDHSVTAFLIPDTNRVEQVFINEILASNVNETMDEAGEYEDWIEIYNAGPKEVDLAGLLLSDAWPASDPWVFPLDRSDATTLESHGFMVLFADGEPEEGPLHTSFKLSKTGEEVVLLQIVGPDTLIVDRLEFGIQARNKTFGRYPDGSSALEYLAAPTPWASNIMTPTGPQDEQWPDHEESVISIYPVPTSGFLYLKFNPVLMTGNNLANQDLTVSIYDIAGILVHSSEHPLSSGLVQLDMTGHPSGLYLVRIQLGSGHFVKRVILQ
jgi:hypothetical protein